MSSCTGKSSKTKPSSESSLLCGTPFTKTHAVCRHTSLSSYGALPHSHQSGQSPFRPSRRAAAPPSESPAPPQTRPHGAHSRFNSHFCLRKPTSKLSSPLPKKPKKNQKHAHTHTRAHKRRRFKGLSSEDLLVYQIIQSSGNTVWERPRVIRSFAHVSSRST